MLDGNLPYIKNSELIVQKLGAGVLNAGEGIEDLRRVTEYDGKQVIVDTRKRVLEATPARTVGRCRSRSSMKPKSGPA